MAISIQYDSSLANTSLYSYFTDWGSETSNEHTDSNRGEFWDASIDTNSEGIRTYFTNQYSAVSSTTGVGFIAEGTGEADSLRYTYDTNNAYSATSPNHTFYGELDSLSFGSGRTTDSSGYVFEYTDVVISGLDISSTYSEGHSGLVHELVYSLIEGDTTVLLDVLDDWLGNYGLSTSNTFAELDEAGLASEIVTTGTAAETESDLALAA